MPTGNKWGDSMNDESQKQLMSEFEELCKPLNAWLQKNFDFHTRIMIESNCAVIIRDEMGISFKVLD